MTNYINKDLYLQIPANERYFLKFANSESANLAAEQFSALGIPFSAVISSYRNAITVYKTDSERAEAVAASIRTQEQNNRKIIGNTEYKYIKDRKFIDTDIETAMHISDILSGNSNIRFSGVIRGNKATITVSGDRNAAVVRGMIENYKNMDLIQELHEHGFERLPDTNGFVNIRNISTNEICGFTDLNAVRQMFYDNSNEFFHPLALRIAYREKDADNFYYYIQRYSPSDSSISITYRDDNNAPVFSKTVEDVIEYVRTHGISITNLNEELDNWKEIDKNRERNSLIAANTALIDDFPVRNEDYLDLVTYNKDTETFSWIFFNPDGGENGEFEEKHITQKDIWNAYLAKTNTNDTVEGNNNFLNYLYENCKENVIEISSPQFAQYAENYISGYGKENSFFGIYPDSKDNVDIESFIQLLESSSEEVTRDKESSNVPENTEPLKTISIDIYSEPDEAHHVKLIGTKTYGEVFDELLTHLSENGLMPDEYLSLDSAIDRDTPVPSDWREFVCSTNFGGSEGIYTDISLRTGKGSIDFATAKTLGETVEDFIRMSRIGAECSMLLNGNGGYIKRGKDTPTAEKFPNGELSENVIEPVQEEDIAEPVQSVQNEKPVEPVLPVQSEEPISKETSFSAKQEEAVKLLAEDIGIDSTQAEQLVKIFDDAALPDWTDNQVKINRIKRAIYDILNDEDQTEITFALISKSVYDFNTNSLYFRFIEKGAEDKWFTESELLDKFVDENPNISFALANAVIEYLDEKQHIERAIEDSRVGYYKKTKFFITAVVDGEGFNYEGRFDIGDGKGTGGGSIIDHIRTFNENAFKSDLYPYNQKEYKDSAKRTLDIFIPFLEKHSVLSAEEEKLLADFKEKYPIRSADDLIKELNISDEIPEEVAAEQVSDVSEKNAEIADSLSVGDTVILPSGKFVITHMDGDFSMSMENTDPNAKESSKMYFGFWKDQFLNDAGDTLIDVEYMAQNNVSLVSDDTSKSEPIAELSEDELLTIDKFEPDNISFSLSFDDDTIYAAVPIAKSDSLVDRLSENLDLHFAKQNYDIILNTNGTVSGTQLRLKSDDNSFAVVDSSVLSAEEQETVERIIARAADSIAEYSAKLEAEKNSYLKNKHYEFLKEKFDAVKKDNPELSERANEILDRIVTIMANNDITSLNSEVINAPAIKIHYGGFTQLDKTFDGKFADVVNQINAAIMNENEYDTAIRLINEYCEEEYGESADFSNKKRVGLAYTTDEITEEPIEVYADLESISVIFEYGGVKAKEEQFNSYAEMNVFLANMSFDEMVAVSDEERSQYAQLLENRDETVNSAVSDTVTGNDVSDHATGGEVTADLSEQRATPTNLSQLKKALKVGMFFEITDHIRSECVGEQRVITSVNSVGFTSKKLDENGEPTGKDIHMDWEKAKNWRFDNDNITSLQNDNRILMTFHIVDSIERSKNAEQEEKPNQTVNSTQEMQNKPEVGMITLRKVGDFWECYGKNAVIAAEILDIHLTQKNGRDMCGFPDFKYDEYRQRLREAGYTILVEEVFNLNPTERISFDKTDIQPTNDENTAKENYTPKINDVVEYEGTAYKIADISGGFLTLQEAETLIPATMTVAIDNFFSNAHSVLSETVTKTAMPLMENNRNSPMGNFEKQDNSANFVITDENFGAVGGSKTRFKLNIEAIRLLKTIESENRTATPDEQQILSNYTGWGAIPQAFDPNNEKWQKEYEELQELLSESEYRAARQSTMNAHYTAPIVISAIYNALENMGFESGRILEPSMGIGNFFGRLPESMQDSKLYGVELDSITGRIAQQLYPSADIQVKGFERTKFPDNFFDIAVSNVPFGDYKLNDKRYNDLHLNIHDYFFAKSLDKVHAGGIVAFVTSKGTLDKENSEVRKYLAERAEFLGAIRLPNNTSKANAGTEVTADIIFLQKRERPITIDPEKSEWINKAENADGFSINKYFVDHPEMVLGKIVEGNKLYGSQANDTSCIPIEGANLKDQLAEAVKNIKGTYKAAEKEITIEVNEDEIPVPENVRTFSYYADNGNLYFYEDGNTMKKVEATKDRINRAIGMVEMRDTVRELLDLQLNNSDFSLDGEINACRKKLNKLYDDFVKKYGNVSDRKNAKALKGDSGYSIVSALEVKDNKGNVIGKADIFNKNTLKPKIITDHVDTAQEALILSISEMGKIDFDFMQSLCGIDKDKMIEQLDGQIFRLPQEEEKYVTSDEYLSGNIRKKIREIENCYDPKAYEKNKNALQEVLPPRVEAKDIAVKLGANWVDTIYIRQFIEEKFKPDAQTSAEMKVAYSNAVGAWKIENVNNASKTNHLATSTFGTSRKNAYEILEAILNNGDLTVKDHKKDKYGNDILDSNGRFVYVPNDKETKAVRACANLIKSEYADWIFKDPDRREKLVNKYNETYNSYRYREYDGSHLNFVGMNTDITLKDHQKDAIARGLFGGNTMLAHCVGAGKTYEMIAIAMEGKRLGLHNKSLFAVPNTITEQVGGDFLKLYPNANILVATPKDFEKKNRKALFAKIATGDWDAVIVGHSQFDRMGLSPKRESAYITSEVNRLRSDLDTIVFNDPSAQKSFSVKQIEKTLKSYEERLEKLKDAQVKDDFIDFEQLGFDKIFVDESHMYKNLATPTKMRNVSGLGSRGSARAFNLLMKATYLDELTDGKGVVFASGTPEYTP